MGKDKLSMSGVDQWRKDEKKKLAKKIKKERDQRKEAKFEADPQQMKQEIERLRALTQTREAQGTNAQMKRKLENAIAIHAEQEKRQAAKKELQADFAPPGQPAQQEQFMDISAITGIKQTPPPRTIRRSEDTLQMRRLQA